MDVAACDGSSGMAEHRGDRHLSEPEIVRHARETVPEHVGSYLLQGGALKEALPVSGKADRGLAFDAADEHKSRGITRSKHVELIEN